MLFSEGGIYVIASTILIKLFKLIQCDIILITHASRCVINDRALTLNLRNSIGGVIVVTIIMAVGDRWILVLWSFTSNRKLRKDSSLSKNYVENMK